MLSSPSLELLLLASDLLCFLGIVPKACVLHAGVQLIQTPQSPLPVERLAHKIKRRLDPIYMSLGLGPHGVSFAKSTSRIP